MTTTEQKKRTNYELFFSTIKDLSKSQGFYSRLHNELMNLEEDRRLKLINQLPDFKDSLDVIFWLEK